MKFKSSISYSVFIINFIFLFLSQKEEKEKERIERLIAKQQERLEKIKEKVKKQGGLSAILNNKSTQKTKKGGFDDNKVWPVTAKQEKQFKTKAEYSKYNKSSTFTYNLFYQLTNLWT